MRFQKIGMRLKNVRSKKRACGCEQGFTTDRCVLQVSLGHDKPTLTLRFTEY